MRPTEVRRTPKKQCCPDLCSANLFLRRSIPLVAVLFLRSSDRFFSKPFPSAAAQSPCFVPRFKSLPLQFNAGRSGTEPSLFTACPCESIAVLCVALQIPCASVHGPAHPQLSVSARSSAEASPRASRPACTQQCPCKALHRIATPLLSIALRRRCQACRCISVALPCDPARSTALRSVSIALQSTHCVAFPLRPDALLRFSNALYRSAWQIPCEAKHGYAFP